METRDKFQAQREEGVQAQGDAAVEAMDRGGKHLARQCGFLISHCGQNLFEDSLCGDKSKVVTKGRLQYRVDGMLELGEVRVQVDFGRVEFLLPNLDPGLHDLAIGGGGYLHHLVVQEAVACGIGVESRGWSAVQQAGLSVQKPQTGCRELTEVVPGAYNCRRKEAMIALPEGGKRDLRHGWWCRRPRSRGSDEVLGRTLVRGPMKKSGKQCSDLSSNFLWKWTGQRGCAATTYMEISLEILQVYHSV